VGVTQQLVGASWLHAAPFQYCGSIGPLLLEPCLQESFTRLGTALVSGCGLRGLFGVDTILRDGLPWLVEVNPRYTASVEVLELALGVALLGGHKKAFEPTNPFSADKDYRFPKSLIPIGPNKKKPGWGGKLQGSMVGKAILFAPCSFVFPGTASWAYQQGPNPFLQQTVALADIPVPGTKIKARQPVFTFFFRAHSVTSCLDGLKEIAADLDRRLFGAYKREDSG
jgi:predicted ATP-grasp superfamily ATP-dependent carboligase